MSNTNPNRPRGHENNAGGYSTHLNSLPEDTVALVPLPEHPSYDDWENRIRQMQARGLVSAAAIPEYVGLYLASHPDCWDDDMADVCDRAMTELDRSLDAEADYTRGVMARHREQI
jgi:hypothetical protein